MRTIQIPTNKPVIRIDDEDALFWTRDEKYTALIKEVIIRHKIGQPILIGTVDIETSELLSHMLNKANIKHEVLNAKNHAKEAEIIAKAGRCGAVTVATNMAGRGTDIKLDPDVRDLGGLAVLASERHESCRIDDQLRGRAGRQGDPGYSRFFVSMEDEMIERYIPKTSGTKRLSAKNVKIAQETIEGINFDQRERMLAYDEVSRLQRAVVYKERDRILSEDPHHYVHELFDRCLVALYERSLDRGGSLSLPKFKCELALIGVETKTEQWHEGDLKCLQDCIWQAYEAKTNIIKRQLPVIERQIILSFLDNAWMEHIDTMEHLKRGISLRSYAQNDPLEVYNKEAFDLFSQMMSDIAIKVTRTMQLLEVKHKQSPSSKQPEDTR